VAHILNEEGVTSPGGSTWAVSAVRTILLNESYLGHRVWNRTRRNKKVRRGTKVQKSREVWVISKNAHPAIIEEDLWDGVQKRRGQIQAHIKNGKGGYNTGRSPYMLSGLLKCDECGANFSMTGAKSRGGARYYRCGYHANRGETVCGNNRLVRQDRIEAATLKALSEDLLRPDIIGAIVEEYRAASQEIQTPADTQGLDKAIRQVEREIANLTASLKAVGPAEELVREMEGSPGGGVQVAKGCNAPGT
jgi:site-specific DNA recombinase